MQALISLQNKSGWLFLGSVYSIIPRLFLDRITHIAPRSCLPGVVSSTTLGSTIFIAVWLFLDGIISVNLGLELHDVASIVARLFLESVSSTSLWLYPMALPSLLHSSS